MNTRLTLLGLHKHARTCSIIHLCNFSVKYNIIFCLFDARELLSVSGVNALELGNVLVTLPGKVCRKGNIRGQQVADKRVGRVRR